jgi:hypothetical protein
VVRVALVAWARRYVTDGGFAVAAIDAPGYGDRPMTEHDQRAVADIRRRREAFASRDKALHAHPGRHAELPVSEPESSQRFLAGRLLT